MKTTLDISEDDPRDDGSMPDSTFWGDDGAVFLRFGELEIRMTWGQADQLFNAYNTWINTAGSDNPFDVRAAT